MKILVTGASGLVGSALIPLLAGGGHEVARLGRSAPGAGDIRWDPNAAVLEASALEGFDGVIHLAGENIASGRWNAARKRRIKESRVLGTLLLAERLAGLERPPRVLVSASAVGFYGDRGDEELTEESPAGSGFLSEVCREWEAATEAAAGKGIRVVHARLGVVLSQDGGALAKMLTPFKLGAGGIVGNGRQYMSWITLDDTAAALAHLLATETVSGPVNLVAPAPVTNREFTKTLGRVLRRPTLFPLPGFVARVVFGEMADALLLASTRVKPVNLLGSGYVFPPWVAGRGVAPRPRRSRETRVGRHSGSLRRPALSPSTSSGQARRRVRRDRYFPQGTDVNGTGRAYVRQRVEGVRRRGLRGALRVARRLLRHRLGQDGSHRRP